MTTYRPEDHLMTEEEPWLLDPRCPWIPTDDRIVLVRCKDRPAKAGKIVLMEQRDLTRLIVVGMGPNATAPTVEGRNGNGVGLRDVVIIPGEHAVTLMDAGNPYFICPGSSVTVIQAKGGTPEADLWPMLDRYNMGEEDLAIAAAEAAEAQERGRILTRQPGLVDPAGNPL